MTNQRNRILVVDDLADWRITLKGMLLDEGFEVQEASSLEQALQVLANERFDLVITDLRLDDSDANNTQGLDLANIIKARQLDIKVVLITGYDTKDTVAQALQPNSQGKRLVADYITKNHTNELPKIAHRLLA